MYFWVYNIAKMKCRETYVGHPGTWSRKVRHVCRTTAARQTIHPFHIKTTSWIIAIYFLSCETQFRALYKKWQAKMFNVYTRNFYRFEEYNIQLYDYWRSRWLSTLIQWMPPLNSKFQTVEELLVISACPILPVLLLYLIWRQSQSISGILLRYSLKLAILVYLFWLETWLILECKL